MEFRILAIISRNWIPKTVLEITKLIQNNIENQFYSIVNISTTTTFLPLILKNGLSFMASGRG